MPGPTVTLEQINAVIDSEHYFTANEPVVVKAQYLDSLSCLTICVLVLKNGFTVIGESACAAPENFNAEKAAKSHAPRQLRRSGLCWDMS